MARYKEIADDMRRRIRDGEWQPGRTIPSIAQLQAAYGVPGLNTIRSAQGVLIGEGLLRTEQGVGVFVVASPPAAAVQPAAGLRAELDLITQAAARATAILEDQERAERAAGDATLWSERDLGVDDRLPVPRL